MMTYSRYVLLLLFLSSASLAQAQVPGQPQHVDEDHAITQHAHAVADLLLEKDVEGAIAYVSEHATDAYESDEIATDLTALSDALAEGVFTRGGLLVRGPAQGSIILHPKEAGHAIALRISIEEGTDRISSVQLARMQFRMQ